MNGTVDDGNYAIQYPNVRWKQLRAIFGWAALQHHGLVHTVLTISPPPGGSSEPILDDSARIQLHLSLKQASFVGFKPRHKSATGFQSVWYEGDIYDQSPHGRIVSLPATSLVDDKLEFDVFLSVDYEIRLFGDPKFHSSHELPTSNIRFSVSVVNNQDLHVAHIGDRLIVPDIVAGKAYGDVVGISVDNSENWNTLSSVRTENKVRRFTTL